jgi:hypothetical protein
MIFFFMLMARWMYDGDEGNSGCAFSASKIRQI